MSAPWAHHMKIKHPVRICVNIRYWFDTNEVTQRKHPQDQQCKRLWLLQGLKCKKKKIIKLDLTTKHFSLCTERSGFFYELDLTWFKSNALINTNAPPSRVDFVMSHQSADWWFTSSPLQETLGVAARTLPCSGTGMRCCRAFSDQYNSPGHAIVLWIIS